MRQKYRFPNFPHIVYFNQRPHNNLALPPVYTGAPQMSQANTGHLERYHIIPVDRVSIDSDAGEDELLVVSLDEPEPQPEPQLQSPKRGNVTLYCTFWIRLFSVIFGITALLVLILCNRGYEVTLMPCIIFFSLSVAWNLVVLLCRRHPSGVRLETIPTVRMASSDKKSTWWWIDLWIEAAIIIGAVIAMIIVCLVTSYGRTIVYYYDHKGAYRGGAPSSAGLVASITLGSIGIFCQLVSRLLDGGTWGCSKIVFRKENLNSDTCVVEIIRLSSNSNEQLLPTTNSRQPRTIPPRDEQEIKILFYINTPLRILSTGLALAAAINISIRGIRRHEALVVLLFLATVTNCITLAPRIVKFHDARPTTGFQLKHFIILWHIILILATSIAWIVSVILVLSLGYLQSYRGKLHLYLLIFWIIVAGISIFLYALATFDSIHPAALYLRLSGNPDNILTWRLYSNIHFDDNNKMAQASTIAPQEGIYDDDVEQGSSNDHLAEAKA